MPLFSYRCQPCGHEFETLVRGDDKPACPACGAADLQKQVARIAPDSKLKSVIADGRAAAAKEGHFSNYSKGETRGKF